MGKRSHAKRQIALSGNPPPRRLPAFLAAWCGQRPDLIQQDGSRQDGGTRSGIHVMGAENAFGRMALLRLKILIILAELIVIR